MYSPRTPFRRSPSESDNVSPQSQTVFNTADLNTVLLWIVLICCKCKVLITNGMGPALRIMPLRHDSIPCPIVIHPLHLSIRTTDLVQFCNSKLSMRGQVRRRYFGDTCWFGESYGLLPREGLGGISKFVTWMLIFARHIQRVSCECRKVMHNSRCNATVRITNKRGAAILESYSLSGKQYLPPRVLLGNKFREIFPNDPLPVDIV